MTPRLPSITPRQLVKALLRKRAGFYICHTTSSGGHVHLCHPDDESIRVDIAMHTKDLKRGTLSAIMKQTKLTREEFLALL